MKIFKEFLEESMYHMAKHAEESAPRRHHEAMLDHHIAMGNHYHEKSIPWSGGNVRMNSHRTDYHTKMMKKHDRAAMHHEDALNLLDKHGKDHPKYHAQRDKANEASQKLA